MAAKLLIIAADSAFRMNLSRRLKSEGYKVFEAGERGQTERTLQRKKIDVVLLGLNGASGEELLLLDGIKTMRPSAEIITLNSSGQLSVSMESMKQGAFDDLLVPLDLDLLLQRIGEAQAQKKEKEKRRKKPLRRYQEMMVAASFAEAGEPAMAREFLVKSKKAADTGTNEDQ